MQKITLLRWIALLFIPLFLFGCAAKTAQDKANKGRYGANAQSSGLGDRSQFSGSNAEGESYNTKAPHQQTYYYRFDNSVVEQKYIQSIEAQANYLKNNPQARVLLEGHTDERGSREYNIGLGERRANSVYDLLLASGVNPRQIRIVSYGQERPKVIGNTEAAYQYNRRVFLDYEA